MNGAISYCGLICGGCPVYLSTREADKEKRDLMIIEIIKMCKEYYGVDYKYEDIDGCDGCKSDRERLFSGCRNCKIRECASGRGIDNCAFCDEYECAELTEIFKAEPGAKTRLDIIREST